VKIDVDELCKNERHGASGRPRRLFINDGNDRLMKEVSQSDLLIAVLRHDVTWRQTSNHNLHVKYTRDEVKTMSKKERKPQSQDVVFTD